jgi:hypothetical protein
MKLSYPILSQIAIELPGRVGSFPRALSRTGAELCRKSHIDFTFGRTILETSYNL